MNNANRPKAAKEVAMHYGNMRFAMFTVFSAVTGALIAFPFSEAGSVFVHVAAHHKILLGVAGLSLSIAFLAAEGRICYLVGFYQECAFDNEAFPAPNGHPFWAITVILIMTMPYILASFFWLFYLCGYIGIPITTGTKNAG